MQSADGRRPGSEIGLFMVRYGIGAVMVIAGIVLLIVVPGTGVDGFAMSVGAGLAVVMINALFRLGVSGEQDRAREEEARRDFDEHGKWPEEPPPKKRQWTLPAGVVSPEDDPPSPRVQFDPLAPGSRPTRSRIRSRCRPRRATGRPRRGPPLSV